MSCSGVWCHEGNINAGDGSSVGIGRESDRG